MFWCALRHTRTCEHIHPRKHTHMHTLNPSFLSSLFIIMLTLRVSLGRRQRGSLLFHKGRLISAKSVCASLLIPHHSCIVWLPGIRKSLISGIDWKCGKSASEAPSPGGFLTPSCGRGLKGESRAKTERETERGRLCSAPSSWGLQSQSCSNIERKAPGPSWVWFLRRYFMSLKAGWKQRLAISLKEACVSPWTTRAHQ